MNKSGQMKKGALEMSILYCVSQKPSYGYEIMKRVSAAFCTIDESTVYAILRRLLEGGHVESYQGNDTSLGPVRKYYRITQTGAVRLQALITSWQEVTASVKQIGIY